MKNYEDFSGKVSQVGTNPFVNLLIKHIFDCVQFAAEIMVVGLNHISSRS